MAVIRVKNRDMPSAIPSPHHSPPRCASHPPSHYSQSSVMNSPSRRHLQFHRPSQPCPPSPNSKNPEPKESSSQNRLHNLSPGRYSPRLCLQGRHLRSLQVQDGCRKSRRHRQQALPGRNHRRFLHGVCLWVGYWPCALLGDRLLRVDAHCPDQDRAHLGHCMGHGIHVLLTYLPTDCSLRYAKLPSPLPAQLHLIYISFAQPFTISLHFALSLASAPS
jgi:hypothetical protein